MGARNCRVGAQPAGTASVLWLWGNHTANYRGCVKWKEARAALAKQAPQRAPKNAPAAPKTQLAVPSAQQLAVGEGWSHVVRGGFCQGYCCHSAPNPNPPPQPFTEVPRQPKVPATRKTASPKEPEPKSTAAAQAAARKSKQKVAASVKIATNKPTIPVLVVPTNPLEENFRFPRSPSHPSMCGADSSAPYVHLFPPHRDSPPAGCLEDRHSLRGRIWQHVLGEQYGVKPCASPAGMLTECGAESSSWSTFSANTLSIFVS